MKRYENQTRPTAGCLSVPLFNQKKRSRLPLTSNPTENEFFPSNEYMPSQGPASSNTSYTRHAHNQAPHAPAVQNSQWNRPDNPQPHQLSQVKPVAESSLRILTAVIAGMRHWSQFKDKAPALFEIYATLDSAVTVGSLGAKNFLMRDGKEVLRCVFYENELELPRLIRGQVHRCVGNYDSGRDVLTCVSVRAALPSEQRNAQEAVRASDAEMRGLVKSLSEV
ncbi:spermatogenesis-associated protein 22 [Osmerus mordax]|uniref:spermatogenesis-associated protein 22 n=1 Tax=Osmerus mordax TaxID=8014 RepID=UPI003510BAC1